MKSIKRNEDAFTGLEAAIVLIAFVVVAAVFSYVVLGAGFFTTQKSQETVHTAVGQASSAIEIVGNVYGQADTAGGDISSVVFSVGLAAGATPVDINKTVLTFSTGDTVETLTFAGSADPAGAATPTAGQWAITHQENSLGTENKVLDSGEQFTITVKPTTALKAYAGFNIDVKPAVGAALAIHRTVPAYTDKVNLLY
ncbi:archaellin/type IV pilin N-terminal domain-containing protein [Methanosphaerula palustris]|uniref:Flagellin n=1 Tax=Methanosphaerula palustris (strain ATCC BAA-1556 / DSM 19958 / E1-9c) TaxID=521011 RepID=B8GEH5_METPE|nr:archaellin/type IV pilin N-terminal domain-containing protein [Methanosphaerula palustris]ACL17676.1 flagellin [Methanosphaerula palustris E1-9c]